jgi:hypothetical protein
MQYAFFVVMGGVQIEWSRISRFVSGDEEEMDTETTRPFQIKKLRDESMMTDENLKRTFPLNGNGIIDLAKQDCWVYIPPLRIEAQKKADLIQKTLVLLQVAWMALQCIARGSYGLPLTLLEIHTMVHVICAMTLYIFWLKVSVCGGCD